MYFFRCKWKAEGKIAGEKQKKTLQGIADDPDQYVFFKEGKNVSWNFLNIEVFELKNQY